MIVATRKLSAKNKTRLENLDLPFTDHNFVSIEFLIDEEFKNYYNLNYPIIFTSQNALHAWNHNCTNIDKPHGKLNAYCITGKTSKLAQESGYNVLQTAKTSKELAQLILNDKPQNLLWSTTNIRLSVFDKTFKGTSTKLHPLELYQKKLDPITVDSPKAVLFFSPSQVDSFLSKNPLDMTTKVFTVGPTTNKYCQKLGFNMVYSPAIYSENALIDLLIKNI